jgi:hypothetical protein
VVKSQHGALRCQINPWVNFMFHALTRRIRHYGSAMPDKWEYPWFAAWDLAFHTLALQIVDPVFAKHQLELIQKP